VQHEEADLSKLFQPYMMIVGQSKQSNKCVKNETKKQKNDERKMENIEAGKPENVRELLDSRYRDTGWIIPERSHFLGFSQIYLYLH
jgi:hypothetical protein